MTSGVHRLSLLTVLGFLVFPLGIGAQTESSVRVEVDGLRPAERRNVLAALSIAVTGRTRPPSDLQITHLHDRAPREIAEALEPFGYYEPAIESDLHRTAEGWTARYEVDPGPRVTIRSLVIEITGPGESDPRITEWRSGFPLAAGEPLLHADYELGKTRFLNAAAESGYLDAAFDLREVRVNRAAATADIMLRFATGSRYRFGPTTFPDHDRDSTLAGQFINYQAGQPFDSRVLLELQISLSESPYYERVEIVPRRDLALDSLVPIEIHLTPRPFQTYEVGGGYGTNSGPRGSVRAEFPRLNRRGLRVDGELLVSSLDRRLTGRFVVPPRSPSAPVFTTQGAYARRTVSTSTSETGLITTSVSRTRGPWQESAGIALQHEAFRIGADTGLSTLLTPTAVLSHTRADNRVFPTHAHRMRIEVQAARRGIASNASFVRIRGRGVVIRSLGRWRFLTRAEGGATFTNTFRRLPPSIRFFTGGDNSVRGFAYRSIGPRDANDQPVGGRFVLIGSTEAEFDLGHRWGVAVFTDLGNALNTLPIRLEQGVGGGVRWRSPVGPVRFDVAVAISQSGRPVRFHVVVGPDL